MLHLIRKVPVNYILAPNHFFIILFVSYYACKQTTGQTAAKPNAKLQNSR